MGAMAVEALLDGESGKMVALCGNQLKLFPLDEAVKQLKPLDSMLLELAEVMD